MRADFLPLPSVYDFACSHEACIGSIRLSRTNNQLACQVARAMCPAQSAALKRGGVLKIGLVSDVHQALDPAREYYTVGWEFMHCCLTRTLLGFNLEGPNEGGNTLQPDLATALPTVSSDGLTYTFKIRSGVHYAFRRREM